MPTEAHATLPAHVHQVPDQQQLVAARQRLAGHAHRTPVLTCSELDRRTGARLFFKCENLQKVGAFKFRGAFATLSSMDADSLKQGVVTHSSGNHAQAVALAARQHGVPAFIVMPENAPAIKVAAVKGYGAEVVRCPSTAEHRAAAATAVQQRTGAALVHPYDDSRIIAGQASVAVELFEQAGPLDAMIVPVGGGGLASGSCLAARHFAPQTAVYAAEPAGADDAWRSLRAGELQPAINVDTIADGLRAPLSALTFSIIQAHIRDIITVSDEQITAAMRLVWERMKIVVEPSAAVPIAALLSSKNNGPLAGKRVGVVISGGNVNLDALPWQ